MLASIDTVYFRSSVAIFLLFCRFLFNNGTESARKWVRAQSRRKTETAAERKRVFGKNIRLVESNEMYDSIGQALPFRVRQMYFGQVSTLILLGFNRFYIVLILRVPADKKFVLLLN